MGPLTTEVAKHHTVWSACCGHRAYYHEEGLCAECSTRCEFQPIKLASGGIAGPDGYLDLRAAMLCLHDSCRGWRGAVSAAIIGAVWTHDDPGFVRVVGTGSFGAMFLPIFHPRRALLWTPKDHGLPCSPFPPPQAGTKVVLVEDVVTTPEGTCVHCDTPEQITWGERTGKEGPRKNEVLRHGWQGPDNGGHFFTGGTLWRMRRWCEERGFEVLGEVVASDL